MRDYVPKRKRRGTFTLKNNSRVEFHIECLSLKGKRCRGERNKKAPNKRSPPFLRSTVNTIHVKLGDGLSGRGRVIRSCDAPEEVKTYEGPFKQALEKEERTARFTGKEITQRHRTTIDPRRTDGAKARGIAENRASMCREENRQERCLFATEHPYAEKQSSKIWAVQKKEGRRRI